MAGAALAALALTGCVRLTAAPPPDQTASEEAVASARAVVEARSIGFRSVVLAEDVGSSWRSERESDDRTGADIATVDRVLTECAGGPPPVARVDSPSYVKATAQEDALVHTQDSARSVAAVYSDPEEADAAFRTYLMASFTGCVEEGLAETGGDIRVTAMAAGAVPGLAQDDDTMAARFTGAYDVNGAPVDAYLDVVVLRHDRVVTVLELSAVNRPFERELRDRLVGVLRDRLAQAPRPR